MAKRVPLVWALGARGLQRSAMLLGMVGLILVVLVVGVVWAMVSNSSRQKALVERKQSLETWEHNEYDPQADCTWSAHFPTMSFRYRVTFSDGRMKRVDQAHRLNRALNGIWSMQLTEESYRREMADLSTRANDGTASAFMAKEHLDRLSAGNPWDPFPPSLAPQLETAYQRYVHQPS